VLQKERLQKEAMFAGTNIADLIFQYTGRLLRTEILMVSKVVDILKTWSSRRQFRGIKKVLVKRVVSCRSAVNHVAALENSHCLPRIIETH